MTVNATDRSPNTSHWKGSRPSSWLVASVILTLATITLFPMRGANASHAPNRVTISVNDHSIQVPALHAGVAALRVVSAGLRPHHLMFLHLNQGASYAQLNRALNGPGNSMPATAVGGNGPILPGMHVDIFLKLEAGRYLIVDIGHRSITTEQRATVPAATSGTSLPAGRGTIVVPAGQNRYVLPPGFGAPGVYRFANRDNEMHDATIVRLMPGKHVADLIAWAKAGMGGRPPIAAPMGGFGAIGGHGVGAFVLPHLAPGSYAVVCFVPGSDGMPHVAMGMAAEFDIR